MLPAGNVAIRWAAAHDFLIEGAPATHGLTALPEFLVRVEERAARARRHAAEARRQAQSDADLGDARLERIHLMEAEAHDRAARVTEETAALYRSRLRHRARS
jgi:hypothetical protein